MPLIVYIIDSPSPEDLTEGYSIGMALRDTLRATRIPHSYKLSANKAMLDKAMQDLPQATDQFPLIHLCMHGTDRGVGLTDGNFISWQDLRLLFSHHNHIKGHDPFVCMASCNGISASQMITPHDSVFSYLIGNSGKVLQSDLTVAYLAFYNHIFVKKSTVDHSVSAMKEASGDPNFYYAVGQQIKANKFNEFISKYESPL